MLWDDAQALPNEKIKLVADDKIRRVVLCSGKVYYDLCEEREKRGIDDVYLLRVEQLYPFPAKALVSELARFKQAEMVWCQEEPRNMGAWFFVDVFLQWVLEPDRRQASHACAMPGVRPRPRPRPGRCRSIWRSSSSSSTRRSANAACRARADLKRLNHG